MANAPTRKHVGRPGIAAGVLGIVACWWAIGAVSLPAQSPSAPEYRSYNLRHTQAAEIEAALVKLLPEGTEVIADQRGNRLLVRGAAQIQQLAQRTVESLDQPSAARASSPDAAEPVLRSYPTRSDDPASESEWLRREFAGVANVRIAADRRTGQILVLAPLGLHERIAQRLRQSPEASPAANRPTAATNGPTTVSPGLQVLDLHRQSAADVETALRKAMGKRMTAIQNLPAGQTGYRINFGPSGEADLLLDHQAQRLGVRGSGAAAESLLRLARLLDTAASGDQSTELVALKNSRQSDVRRAIEAIQTGAISSARNDDSSDISAAASRLRSGASLAMMFQKAGQGASADVPARTVSQETAAPEGEPAASRPGDGTSLIGPVQIELLEGLDVLIVRGHQRDVEQVNRIIQQIERLSAETEPSIEVYTLQHADGDAMATLVAQVYSEVFSPRHGNVTILPLVKPNALLLVGRPENVRTAIDLVKRLDQPVAPETQFKVFPLRHATAVATENVVQEFFFSRGSLGTRARVTADVRSNSLVVQASPRDLLEVGELIARIDTSTSEAVNELRVFPLENSLATEMATILQAAIYGQTLGNLGTRGTTGAGGAAGILGGGGGAMQGTSGMQNMQGVQGMQGAMTGMQGGMQGMTGSAGMQGAMGTAAGAAGSTARNTTGANRTTTGGGAARSTLQGLGGNMGAGRTGIDQKTTMLRFVTVDAKGQRVLNSGILTDVRITPDARQNTLLVSAPADSMELIAALIRQLDSRPTTEVQIKVFTIVNGDASNLSSMLQMLFGLVGGTGQAVMAQSSGDGESSLITARFVADLRTNSIIASGSTGDLAIAEAILLRLDDNDARRRKSVVYRLKNAPATDVSNAVNQFLTKQQQSPEILSTVEQIENEAVVVPEPVSNSLIVSATPRFYDEIKSLVEQLDKRPAMVMIQVLIAQVSLSNFKEFGIEAGLQDSILFDRGVLGDISTLTHTETHDTVQTSDQRIVSATNTPGYNFNNQALGNGGSDSSLASSNLVGTQGLNNFGLGRTNSQLGYGGFVFSASSEGVSVLIRALSEKRRLEVLSRPQVMTLDNQAAFVQVGERVPRITNVNVTTVGQVNQTTLDNVGIILKVIPRISPDGLVVMEIDAEKSELGSEAEGIPISIMTNGQVIRSPRISTTIAQTTVSAVSGQTVVLGGLITKNKEKIERRVPYLSDIPILGYLFRYDSNSNKRNELLIVMTPRIVQNEDDTDRLKQIEAARMNWCLADVEGMHGDIGVRQRQDEWADGETKVVHPDQESIPTPEGTPTPAGSSSGSKKKTSTKPQPPAARPPEPLPWPSNERPRVEEHVPAVKPADSAYGRPMQPEAMPGGSGVVPAVTGYGATSAGGVVPAGYQRPQEYQQYQQDR